MPSYDDEELGFQFFRTRVEGDYRSLTLPRTFFGRSEISADFSDADLTESRLCWNDFLSCSFANSTLERCDLRSSVFQHCSFRGASLVGADLRRTDLAGCDFEAANLTGATAERDAPFLAELSAAQRASMVLTKDPGEEPGGG
jgi:uncharacterized protein YjbI with pentapeptide repeats